MTPAETPIGSCFCILCRKMYMKKEVHDHMQGMLHHRELENVKGRDCYHQCQACQMSIKGLNDFAKHISTSEHGVKMKTMCRMNKKPLALESYLDKALIIQIHARNKELKRIARKEKSKKKKLDLIMQKNLKEAKSEKQKTPSQEKKVKPSQEKKVKPSLEKKVKPSLEKKVKPSLEKKVKPSQEKKVKPSQEKKVKPSLEKKVKPSQEKKVKPSQEKKVKPSKEKKVKPSLEKKVTPTQMKEKIQKKPLPIPIPKKKTPKQSLQIKNGKKKAQNKENRLAGKLTPQQSIAQPSLPNFWKPPEYTWYSNHEDTTLPISQFAWINCTNRRYGTQNGTDIDFTSDHLPSSGAIIFNNCPDKDLPSTSAPVPPSRLQDNTSGPSQDDNTSPVRNLDVPAMLRQVKRALRVREPCRGSPATPTQGHSRGAEAKGEALGSRIHSGGMKEDRAERAPGSKLIQLATSLHSAAVSKPASLPSSSTSFVQSPQVSTSNSVPKGGMPLPPLAGSRAQLRTRTDKAEENTPLSKVSREMISDNNRPCSGETEPLGESAVPRLSAVALPTSLSRHVGKAVAHEPNLNAARRIRNVGEARKGEVEKVAGLKPTLKKLLSSAGSQRKVNWKEMYQEANRKKQETIKGMPRFGIEMVNPLCDPDGLTLDEDEDLPLAEGFQWEAAFPDGPLPPPAQPSLPSAPESTPADDVARQQQAEASTQHMEQPSTASRTSKSSAPVTVKTEALEKQYGRAGGVNNTCDEQSKISVRRKEKKRKLDSELTNTSSLNHCVKKRKVNKSKNDQGQVDELLAVSLREEELSSSMHSVDSSLIQARNVLQSAYSEVQRLLVVKQQVTAEINKLRAKRIDILQGMQGGYSGGSGMEEDCVEPGLAAATVPSNQHPQILPLSIPHIASPILAPTIPSPAFPNLVTSLPSLTPTHLTSSMPTLNTLQPAPSNSPTLSIKHERVSSHSQDLLRNSHFPLVQAATQVTHNIAPQMSSATVLHPLPKYSSIIPVPLPTSLPMHSTSLPAVPLDNQQRAENSSSGGPLPLLKSVREYKEKMIMKLKQEYEESTCSESEEDLVLISSVDGKLGLGAPVSEKEIEEVEDSDSSVETVESTSGSDLEIVAIDDSDVEDDLGAHVPVGHNPSKSLTEVCVGVSSSSTQTAVRTEDQKNIKLKTEYFNSKDQLSPVPVKDQKISSGSADVAEEEEPSLGSFEGNTSLVHDLQIHGGLLYTCSGHTAQAYSLVTRECQAVFEGHSNKVNCLLVFSLPGLPARLYTGSSDRTIRCYSIKSKKCLELISLPDRILCLHICWKILYVGLANGSVVSIDLKTQRLLDTLECHGPRGVSCLDTAQEGARRVLLVGSYDSSISVRDARSGLLLRTLEGHTKTVLCMKVVNDLVFSGSSDRSVHAHNIHTGELVRIYKGHGHAVTALAILGKVMVTACLDKLVRVYELHSHDRLQVYGGHSDMVMCMAIHKSVIYTGCYDGSVQAVRLNLMCNHRCWWHGCTLIFGVTEHLLKHLLNDHGNPSLHTFKCRWRDCSSFFATQDSCKLELPRHMQIHIAKDSKLET